MNIFLYFLCDEYLWVLDEVLKRKSKEDSFIICAEYEKPTTREPADLYACVPAALWQPDTCVWGV